MKFSAFGDKFTKHSGITQLMADLDEGVRGDDFVMLGGGNPGVIPELRERFSEQLQKTLEQGTLLDTLCNYDGPQGNLAFIESLASLFQEEFNWAITSKNIALTNGSQNAFFYLFNLFAGAIDTSTKDGRGLKKVLFPLAPEYIGYSDSGLDEAQFVACKPLIEIDESKREFKYHIDFDQLSIGEDVGLICVSRPTNPTGNVLTDDEIIQLDQLARQHDIPLLIDNAYGVPFPHMIFNDSKAFWNENTILCLSLSKFGLPGARCGIIIADEKIIQAIGNLSGIINLAPGGIGPMLTQELIDDRSILSISQNIIRPFYQQKSEFARQLLLDAIPDQRFRIHRSEGAMFLWLWFEDLPLTSQELYQKLKEKGVIVVSGHYFFPGLDSLDWKHMHECIRLNFALPEEDIRKGVTILADVINGLYE